MRLRKTALFCSLLSTVMPLSAGITGISVSAETQTYDLLSYEINTYGTVTIKGCDKSVTDVEIPAQIDGIPVTEIGASAFSGCTSLTSVTIPDSVSAVGMYAFDNTALKAAQTEGVIYADTWAIGYKGSDSAVTLRDGTKGIAYWTFLNNSYLESVTLPEDILYIDRQAFYGCSNLAAVNTPDSLLHVDSTAFNYTKLKTNAEADSYGFKYAGDWIIEYNGAQGDAVTVPDGIHGLATEVFSWKNIVSIDLPHSLFVIDDSALFSCEKLLEIDIPDSVVRIGIGAFRNDRSLTALTVPDSVKSIGASAFSGGSSLTEVQLSDGLEYIGNSAFASGTLERINIPHTVTYIGSEAFQNSALKSLSLPDSIEYIGAGLCRDCKSLKYVQLPSGITRIPDNMFYDCTALQSLDIPNTVTEIGEQAFWGAKLLYLELGENIQSVGKSAFAQNAELATLIVRNADLDLTNAGFGSNGNCHTAVYGYTDSTAEALVAADQKNYPNGMTFTPLDSLPDFTGDVDLNGAIDIADAVLASRIIAEDTALVVTAEALRRTDVDEDHLLTMLDVSQLLSVIMQENEA